MKIAPDHLKWVALVALVLQNSGIAILMRFTMINKPKSEQYAPSTAVLWSEVLKLVLSSILCFYFDAKSSWRAFVSILQTEGRQDLGKLCVPSVLYTLQNSLQFISICNLSAPVYQVLYQMKIITTAVFSVMILQRRIYSTQWLSIIALAAGVALVQLSQHAQDSHAPTSSRAVAVAAGTPLDHPDLLPAHPEPSLTKAPAQNSMIGLISVLCGCLTSGFAGVYFEMVLKASASSIWVRNIQLSVIGIIISAAACYFRDYNDLSQRGFFAGYGWDVLGVIVLQAAGGMIVATVVKYADNVLKGFATSCSIIISAIWSAMLFHDVEINSGFLIGGAVVIGAVFGFGHSPSPPLSSVLPKSLST